MAHHTCKGMYGVTHCACNIENTSKHHTKSLPLGSHIHRYIQLTQRMSMTTLAANSEFAHAHLEPAKGKPAQNEAYCTKPEGRVGGPYRSGTLRSTTTQGQRSDLVNARDQLKQGKRFMDLVDDDELITVAAKFPRFVERLETEFNAPPARSDIHVVLHFGPAGTGKSHCACGGNPADPDIYYFDGQGVFWEGYKGQKTVILDEFGGHVMSPLIWQRVCDKYPFIVPLKGRSTPLLATTVHITTNYLPNRWWKEGTRYNQEAVYRRIHEVHWHRSKTDFDDVMAFTSNAERSAMDQFMEFYVRENFVRCDE